MQQGASATRRTVEKKPAKPRAGTRASKSEEGERPTRANGRATRQAMREAAVDLFYEHGYKNVSLRFLASEVGVQAGSLYNHISTKQNLLFVLLQEIMEDVLISTKRELEGSHSVLEELQRFVQAHLDFHTSRLKEVYIGNSELRNLEPENRKIIVGLRKKYFDIIHDIIQRGSDQRLFVVPNTQVVARVVMGMLNGVAGWYRADGESSVADITRIYLAMIFRALGAPVAAIEGMPQAEPTAAQPKQRKKSAGSR